METCKNIVYIVPIKYLEKHNHELFEPKIIIVDIPVGDVVSEGRVPAVPVVAGSKEPGSMTEEV